MISSQRKPSSLDKDILNTKDGEGDTSAGGVGGIILVSRNKLLQTDYIYKASGLTVNKWLRRSKTTLMSGAIIDCRKSRR